MDEQLQKKKAFIEDYYLLQCRKNSKSLRPKQDIPLKSQYLPDYKKTAL
jgi:hypothetical protein